jgi:maleylacetoacetate isomerase
MSSSLILYSYWRSSAAYRVRIALNLKGLDYEVRPIHLVNNGGEQHSAAYRALNPQELLPTLIDGNVVLGQSLAIMEYLEETRPDTSLLPVDASSRAAVRALAQAIAADMHPLGNLRTLQELGTRFNATQEQRVDWTRHWIKVCFDAVEQMLADTSGRYCYDDSPGLADTCLVPQVYNARRWDVSLAPYPNIMRIDAACNELEAFPRAPPAAPGANPPLP